jgi:hypothetical protein
MKLILPLSTLVTLLLSAAIPPAAAAIRIDLLGGPAPASAADYTIVIQPDTRYVNVKERDTVRFVAGSKTFTWNFFVGRSVSSFDLNQVAPGFLDHRVTAYIGPDPQYMYSGVL